MVLADRGSAVPTAHFYGDASICPEGDPLTDGCQKYMMQATQGYAVKVVAEHLMAMCYYAQAYPARTGRFVLDSNTVRSPSSVSCSCA